MNKQSGIYRCFSQNKAYHGSTMIKLLRILAIIWAGVCIYFAVIAAMGMYITFAPSQGRTGELASAELAGLERALDYWCMSVWEVSGMLMISAAIIVVAFWKRR